MNMFIEFCTLMITGVFGLVVLFSAIVAIDGGLEYVQHNTMQKLGYEAKYVNFSCYAKQQDKWLDCSEVTKNTQNVNIKEVK